MVGSVSSNTPYSYLQQLTGQAAFTAPATTTTDSTAASSDSSGTSDAATASSANALGLPPEVLTLLQSIGGDSTISTLLGVNNNSTNSSSSSTSLVGSDTTPPSAGEILAGMESDVMSTNASSGLYQAALSGANLKKTQTALSSDPVMSMINAYNATAMSNLAQKISSFNTTG